MVSVRPQPIWLTKGKTGGKLAIPVAAPLRAGASAMLAGGVISRPVRRPTVSSPGPTLKVHSAVPDAPSSFAGRIANLRSVHCAIRRCLFMSLQHGAQRTMGPDASEMAAGRPFLAVSHPARARYRAKPDRPAFPATSSVVGQSAWPACQPAVGVLRRRECQRRATAASAIVKERRPALVAE